MNKNNIYTIINFEMDFENDFEKSDSVITIQLIIDKIKLPDVLLDIIKDYIIYL